MVDLKDRYRYSWGVVYILSFLMILLAYCPHLQKEMIQGSDDWFHFHRIYALASELKQGIFPVKIHHLAGFGYGYGVGFFYSNFFLYIPAILINLLNLSLGNAYRLFAFLIYMGIYVSMFYCVKQLTGKKEYAFWAASIYLFSNKVLEAFYSGMALGQMCAFIFLPMAIVGMYLFLEKEESPILLMLGFIGLIYSHTISTFLAFVICLVLVILDINILILDIRKMIRLTISVCITALVTTSFWIPMLEQMKAQILKVKTPWTTSEENILRINDIVEAQSGLGYVVTFLFIFNLVIWVVSYLQKKEIKEYKFLLISATMILLTLYKPFWHFMNVELGIKFLQFPSRLLAPVTGLIIINTSMILKDIEMKKMKFLPLLALAASIVLSNKTFSECYYSISDDHINKAINNEIAAFGAGEEWLPIMTNREEILDAEIAIDNEGNQVVGEKEQGYSRYVFIADLEKEYYNIPYIWYKGYIALDDQGNKFEISQNEDTGMVQVHIPEEAEGTAQIEVYYGGTKYQKLAYLANVIGIILFLFYIVSLKKNIEIPFSKTENKI